MFHESKRIRFIEKDQGLRAAAFALCTLSFFIANNNTKSRH